MKCLLGVHSKLWLLISVGETPTEAVPWFVSPQITCCGEILKCTPCKFQIFYFIFVFMYNALGECPGRCIFF